MGLEDGVCVWGLMPVFNDERCSLKPMHPSRHYCLRIHMSPWLAHGHAHVPPVSSRVQEPPPSQILPPQLSPPPLPQLPPSLILPSWPRCCSFRPHRSHCLVTIVCSALPVIALPPSQPPPSSPQSLLPSSPPPNHSPVACLCVVWKASHEECAMCQNSQMRC